MKKAFLIVLIFSLPSICAAQALKIKGGLVGLPFFEGFPGFIVNGGIELMNKKSTASWQVMYSHTEGATAQDAPSTARNWITADKLFYVKSKSKFHLQYSVFAEVGNRIEYPGYSYFPQNSILNNTKSTEINIGISGGADFKFSKHVGIQFLIGPKLIIANYKKTWYNAINQNYFFEEYKDSKIGFRFNPCLYYGLNIGKKRSTDLQKKIKK